MYFVFTSFWNYKVKKDNFHFFIISWVPMFCSYIRNLMPPVSSCIGRYTTCTGSCCWSS
jgi:hypothetical protein